MEEIVIEPIAAIRPILFPWLHPQLPHVPIKRRGANLQCTDRLCGGKYDPLLGTFYSGRFSFHLMLSAPHSFGIARDSSHRSASNRILSAADSSNPTATISLRRCTALRSSQAMRSSPGRGARRGCVCVDVAEVMIWVPSTVCASEFPLTIWFHRMLGQECLQPLSV